MKHGIIFRHYGKTYRIKTKTEQDALQLYNNIHRNNRNVNHKKLFQNGTVRHAYKKFSASTISYQPSLAVS